VLKKEYKKQILTAKNKACEKLLSESGVWGRPYKIIINRDNKLIILPLTNN
jgi:hypothetical protein